MLEQLFVAAQAFKMPPLRSCSVNSDTHPQIFSQDHSQLVVFDIEELFTEPISLVTWLPDEFIQCCQTLLRLLLVADTRCDG